MAAIAAGITMPSEFVTVLDPQNDILSGKRHLIYSQCVGVGWCPASNNQHQYPSCIRYRSVSYPDMPLMCIEIYASNYEFFVDLYFDKVSAVYLVVGAVLTFLVTIYSRYYLHRERGYKRFFVTILFFYLGYNITILAGNFETLFIGWELLGTSSFLLIAYLYFF